jgi:hypothetical protein
MTDPGRDLPAPSLIATAASPQPADFPARDGASAIGGGELVPRDARLRATHSNHAERLQVSVEDRLHEGQASAR